QTRIRSPHPRTCGLRYAPTRGPSPASSASIIRVVVDLPFVPTTCTASYSSCGSPSRRSRSRIRPRPNSAGHGLSDSTQEVELTSVARELVALGLDDVRRRVRDEAL